MLNALDGKTIAAVATPHGFGAIGIIRLSGPKALEILQRLGGPRSAQARQAHRCFFHEPDNGALIDEGLAIYFPGPNSFTGEDVVELQAHGSPAGLRALLRAALHLGAREALPGEFSLRAFSNGKMDLTQAEAVADLIHSQSDTAVRAAANSLHGAFSREVEALAQSLTQAAATVEAHIDFADEEIPENTDEEICRLLKTIEKALNQLIQDAESATALHNGFTVVIAGPVNAGKSSLFNRLCMKDGAIVSNQPGTTRDLLHEQIQIERLDLKLIDTAGLRTSGEAIEKIGIERAKKALGNADAVLWVVDGQDRDLPRREDLIDTIGKNAGKKTIIARNKCDLSQQTEKRSEQEGINIIDLSAKTGQGINLLRSTLVELLEPSEATPSFTARARHLACLKKTLNGLKEAKQLFLINHSLELLAEDIKSCRQTLGEIVGNATNEEVLDQIFSEFCIGK